VVETFQSPSSSMEPALEIGDHFIVNKLSYGLKLPFSSKTLFNYSSPGRGDIVVFSLPDDPNRTYVKRVVAIEGDEVGVQGIHLYINGKRQEEERIRWLRGGVHDFNSIKVPKGHIFLLGDNRDMSRDSRFWNPPYLETSQVLGKAVIIFWNSNNLDRIFNIVR